MSDRERIELLNTIPDYKIGYVLAYVQGVAADHIINDKRRIVELFDTIPEYKMPYVLAYIQSMVSTDEEKPAASESNAHICISRHNGIN